MAVSLLIAAALVVATIVIHYEVLRLISVALPRMRLPLRLRILVVVLGCFAAHTIEVWAYAAGYLLLDRIGLGTIHGNLELHFADYLYFSVTSYSTLGFGDIYPAGALRLISGIEALNGLFLIGWSTSFTYLAMERLWPLHTRARSHADRRE